LCQGASCVLPIPGRSRPNDLGVCGRGTLGHVKRGIRSRLIVKLTLCTFAGAVVTWGVAWGIALWAPTVRIESHVTDGPWPVDVTPDWPSPNILWTGRNAFCAEWTWEYRETIRGQPGVWNVIYLTETGWPMRSMRMIHASPYIAGFKNTHICLREGDGNRRWYFVPTEVLPLGFALNTLLAAALLLGMTETIGLARRRLRSRKGLCPACGYSLSGLAATATATACPECGRSA
jgi:hypothetical protein